MQLPELVSCAKGVGTRRLVEAWQSWRKGRIVPLKSAMDLRDVRMFLPWLGLLELGDADIVRARLAGTALRDVFGIDMTGRNLKRITRQEDWARRNARCRSLFNQPCGSIFRCTKPLADGKMAPYETVALPLDVDPSGSHRHILYCVARIDHVEGEHGARRRRSSLRPVQFEFVDIGCGSPPMP